MHKSKSVLINGSISNEVHARYKAIQSEIHSITHDSWELYWRRKSLKGKKGNDRAIPFLLRLLKGKRNQEQLGVATRYHIDWS